MKKLRLNVVSAKAIRPGMYVLAFLCLLIAFFFHMMELTQVSIILVFIAGGVALFLVLDKPAKPISQANDAHRIGDKTRTRNRIIDIAIILLPVVSLVILGVQGFPLSRPPVFYILLAVAYGLVFLRIASYDKATLSRTDVAVVLIEILWLTSLLKWSFFFGVFQFEDDPGAHLRWVENIAQTGFLSKEMAVYYAIPAFHILASTIGTVAGLDIGELSIVAALAQSISVILVYLLSMKFIGSIKVSLYSALIFSVLSLNLKYSLAVTTEGISLLVVLLTLYCIISLCQTARLHKQYALLFVFFFVVGVFWHHFYSAISLLWVLISIGIAIFVINKDRLDIYSKERRHQLSKWLCFLGLFAIILWTAHIAYSNAYLAKGAADVTAESLITQPLFPEPPPGPLVPELPPESLVPESPPEPLALQLVLQNLKIERGPIEATPGFLTGYVLTYLSIFLLICLGTTGALLLIRHGDRFNRWLVVLIATYSIIILFPAIKDIELLRPRIHFYFLEGLLAILAGYTVERGMQRIIEGINIHRILLVTSVSLFIAFSLFSIASRLGNELDPIFYAGEVPVPFYHSYHERMVLQDMLAHVPEGSSIVTDLRTGSRGCKPSDTEYKLDFFSDHSLPELDRDYDYIILNADSITKGIFFVLGRKGCRFVRVGNSYSFVGRSYYGCDVNRHLLSTRLDEKSLLWNSGVMKLYK